jgi:hypothetical protein
MRVPRTRLIARRRCPARRVLPSLAAALALPVLLGACATTVVAGRGSPAPLVLPEPVETGDGSETPTAEPPSTSPPPGGPPAHVTFGAVSFDVPGGWRSDDQGGSLCLSAPDAQAGTCTLLVVDVARAEAAHQVTGPPDPKASQGWWLRTGPPMCSTDPPVPVTGSELTGSGFVKMRNKTAAYATWQVHCADPDVTLSPRLWWLPRTRVAFLQERGGGPLDAQVDRLVASVTVA